MTAVMVQRRSPLSSRVVWPSAAFIPLVLCAIGTPALAQGGNEPTVEPFVGGQRENGGQVGTRINLDVVREDLREVMDQIGRRVNRNILVDPDVNEEVTVALRDVPWLEAVEVIAQMTRCEVEERQGGVLMLTQPPKVTIQFTDANVRTVLQLLAAYSGKNIIIAPEVGGRITLDLKQVHWLRALYAIVRTVGEYEVVEETDDLLRVVPRSSIEQQLDTVVFPLRYVRPPAIYRAVPPSRGVDGTSSAAVFVGRATATNLNTAAGLEMNFTLFRALRSVVAASSVPGAILEYDLQTNSFIVTATTPLLRQIERIIQRVDRAPTQIYTEVKFVTTRDNNNYEAGVEFSPGDAGGGVQLNGPFPDGRFGNFGNLDPQGQPIVTQPVGQYPFVFGNGVDSFTKPFNIPAILDVSGLDMALNLIDRDDRSRIVQSPSLFIMDNQDAVIFVGENVPYAELRVTPDANGNVQQQLSEGDDSPVSVGFSLFLQPHVVPNSGGRIYMSVIPRVNDLVGTTSPLTGFERFGVGQLTIDLPRTREQALVTNVMLDDSYTAVLGGLITETDTEVLKKVPILSSIPIIGTLFTNRVTTRRLENLTIFITPTILQERENTHTIFLRATRRLEEADPFFRDSDVPDSDLELEEDE
jgi:type IV pilus assembly protein PilQ